LEAEHDDCTNAAAAAGEDDVCNNGVEAVCPNDIISIITTFVSMACSTPPPACLLTANTVKIHASLKQHCTVYPLPRW
jgi:hypothetical protein